MKRGLAVAQPASPPRRSSGSGGSGLLKAANTGSGSTGSLVSLGSIGRAMNRLKLPRRNASGANEDFGDFAFRPSRFNTPGASPQGGSPVHGPREVAAAGAIFTFAGPSRFSHSRNPSKGSPTTAVASGAGSVSPPPAAVLTADCSGGAAQGLAAALAALPPGSPLRHESSGPPGIELSEMAPSACGGGADWGEPADVSNASTPGTEAGSKTRARRPLLTEQVLRSTDRQPDSVERGQGHSRTIGALTAAAGASSNSCADAQLGAQGAEERSGSPDLRASLSFGSVLRSISLQGGHSDEGEGEEHADTATSNAAHPSGAAGSSERDRAGASTLPGGLLHSAGGSTAALLPLGQQQSTSQGVERSGGSAAALLPVGTAVDSSSASGMDSLPVQPRHAATSSFEVATSLGYAQTPPDPEEIYAAIISKSSSPAGAAAAIAMARKGRRLSAQLGAGDAVDGGVGGVGEGIATSWWKTYQGKPLLEVWRACKRCKGKLGKIPAVHAAGSDEGNRHCLNIPLSHHLRAIHPQPC